MASIRKEIVVRASAEEAWAAVRDVGAVHRRLAPGFVTDVRLDGDARVVTFASGLVVRELVVAVDDEARRLAYAAVGGQARHHAASMQVLPEGTGSRLVWITDVLPHELARPLAVMVEAGARAIERALDRPA